MFKDELGGKIMKEFCALISVFENYKDSFLNDKTILQSQLRFKSDHHDVYIKKKSIKLHLIVMMIRDCKHLIELQHIHMEQMLLKYVKLKC